MPARSWIAVLLLINYLLVVGAGCVNRPDDPHPFVRVQTNVEGYPYQPCRYLRLDALDAFLADALASRYKEGSETTSHHLIYVLGGVDAHCLSRINWPLFTSLYPIMEAPLVALGSVISRGAGSTLYAPPW